MKVFIGIVCVYLIVVIPVYAMLCAAGREDEQMERIFREYDSRRRSEDL